MSREKFKKIPNLLPNIYPDLNIYIPELKLAFKLTKYFNDDRKFAACSENNISLCVIDTSGQNYFKEETSIRYLDIIKGIIDKEKG